MTDRAGNQAALVFDVRVLVNIPPEINWGDDATAQDNLEGAITPECTFASPHLFALGTHEVKCTASDSDHNEGSESFRVTVRDTIAPAVT